MLAQGRAIAANAPPRVQLRLMRMRIKLIEECVRDIQRQRREQRSVAGYGAHPDFRTINRFRARHREDFVWVLRATVDLARRSGMAKLGVVAVDGTKLRANTSRHKAMSYGRMRKEERGWKPRCRRFCGGWMRSTSARTKSTVADGEGGGGLPAELQSREERLAKIRALREQLEQERGAKVEDRHQKSFADPEAQMMQMGDGALVYAYNAQAAVSEDGLIVATGLTTARARHGAPAADA